MPATTCSLLLLAGGQGARLGGRDKGLVSWRGKPLIEHLVQVVRPLTDELIISCNRNAQVYDRYADRLVTDDSPDYPGPLAGIRAGLKAARHPQLLVLPCDSPLIDRALLQALQARAGERPVMVRQGGYWQPLFCVLPKAIEPIMEAAWQAGERSPQRIFRRLDPVALDCAEDDPRLANLNTQELLNDLSPGPVAARRPADT